MTTFESSLTDLTTEAYERGHVWARSSASLMLAPEDQRVLEDIGRSIAQRAACTPFDPASNIEDRHAVDAHEKAIRDLADSEMAVVNAAHLKRQREDERARLGADVSSPPSLPQWMTVGGTGLFAMAFSIGVFDWIHERLADAYLAALAALIPSVALGIFVVRALTSAESPSDRKVGFIAGLGISVGTGILRLAFSPDEWLIAVALTLIELFVVTFLDWHGGHVQNRYQQWLGRCETRASASRLLEAAREQQQRAEERVAELTEASARHLREVARRSLFCQKAEEIEAAVVRAVIAGAHAGCAENQGLRRGVSPVSFRQAVQ